MNNLVNFGQHFLIDKSVINSFIKICEIEKNETVLEIGPGQGALTTKLCELGKSVTALEVDKNLRPGLAKLLENQENLELVFTNALKWQSFNYDLVCGALSFAIFEPLMIGLIGKREFKRAVFLVSYKVEKDFEQEKGLLFYLLNAFYKAEFTDKILPSSFSPKPRTCGIIVKLKPERPESPRFLAWQKRFLQDKTIWQKTSAQLQVIDQEILYT